ncbi:hypothetical protein [Nocardia nepalensis]|uniref:hypothetical protein n=1 Tax=Nocardia nepalensis TaxID=3375448 RepID=UPI003B680FC6
MVLAAATGGLDYSSRELIRLVKLVKYRRSIPLSSYFVEVFCLRWLEGSESYGAASIAEIVEACGSQWTRRSPGRLITDIPELLTSLGEYLRSVAVGSGADMVDLTTPETGGTVGACRSPSIAAVAADSVARVADIARRAAEIVDPQAAIALWRSIFQFDGEKSHGAANSSTNPLLPSPDMPAS